MGQIVKNICDEARRGLEDKGSACDGCRRKAFVLRYVDGAKLCDGCAERSARIDQQLATVRSGDPVACDGCRDRVDFDARVAVVTRTCGGIVLCDHCKPVSIEGEPS
jgi:hypothetical protein